MDKKNKNIPPEENKKPKGVSTKSYIPPKPKREAADEAPGFVAEETKLCLTKKQKTIIISSVAAVLAAVIIGLTIFFVLKYIGEQEDRDFDYVESDLSSYVTLSADQYKNYSLNIDIAKPHLKNEDGSGVSDVDMVIMSLIAKSVGDDYTDGTYTQSKIAVGDDVYIWYRGYIVDAEGREIDIGSATNFSTKEDNITSAMNMWTVGAGDFEYIGLEYGLVGVDSADYASFKKITDRAVLETDTVYISCKRTDTEGNSEVANCARIDLNDADKEAWKSVLIGKECGEIADFTITEDGKTYSYTGTKIEFITDCENDHTKPRLRIETYAPYDSSIADLRNETVYFDVYVAGVIHHNPWHKDSAGKEYDISIDWNEAFLESALENNTLGIDRESLNKYSGDSLTQKYEAYALESIWDTYYEILDIKIEDAMWEHYLSVAEIHKYPEEKVEKIYQEYVDDVEYQFDYSGGAIYNYSTLQNETYDNIDDYAFVYLQIQNSTYTSWQAYLEDLSRSLVAERLILYYIMEAEDISYSEEVFSEKYAALRQEYLDEYIRQEGTDTSGYSDEEYADYIAQCEETLFSYYNEEYFEEQTYYALMLEVLVDYPTIITLDESPALPQDK